MASKRLEMRKQAEAAEARGALEPTKKAKKSAGTKTKRVKEKVQARKRLVWVVYNGSMKEEGRFPYDQRDAAEERIEQLKLKSKKMYFIQPLKEIIGEPPGSAKLVTAEIEEDDVKVTARKRASSEDEDEDEDEEEEEDDDDDE